MSFIILKNEKIFTDVIIGELKWLKEVKTDLWVARQFDDCKINYDAQGSDVKELNEALQSASKRGTGNAGYLPEDRREHDNLVNTIYPEGIESVPKRFAISWRNKWMLRQADTVITYTTHPSSGAYEFEQLALKQVERVINVSYPKGISK